MMNAIKNVVYRISIISTLLGILFMTSAFANTTSLPSIFDIMSYQEVLEVTIEGDFEILKNNRRNEEGQKMALSFVDAKGKEQVWQMDVSLRGKFRRMNCTAMPPLKLNFKKSALREANLEEFDDLKLVTQCIEGAEDGKDAVLKEYLAYKLYNGLTDESFRVQLLKITYKDTGTGSANEQWGFLVEDTAQLRSRIGAKKSQEERGFVAADFSHDSFYKMAVFQYMIGNGDWDIVAGRNIKTLTKGGKTIAIPYDFDFSGLVNATYAIPNGNYGMTSIQERVYLGFPEDINNLGTTLNFFRTRRTAIRNIVKDFKLLKFKERREILNYLGTFFDTMDTIELRERRVITKVETQID